MPYRLLADAVLIVHVTYIAFAVLGGLLVLRWRRVAWIHVPALVWAIAIEYAGWWCPLTPLENRFRTLSGSGAYETGFVERYLLPLIYPVGLTRKVQIALGTFVLLVNVGVYLWVLRAPRRAATPGTAR